MRIEARSMGESDTFTTSRGTSWDLQRNVAIAFEVKRRITGRNNRRYNDDMIVVASNAASSIALRNSVLKNIPKAFWQPVYEAARKAAVGTAETLVNKRAKSLEYFKKLGVTDVRMFSVLGVKGLDDITLEHLFPGLFQALGRMEFANVNLPVAALIWLMIIPMLVKIDFAALTEVRRHWRGIGVTLFINWAVKPFSMAILGWFFIGYLFRPYLPADQINSYIAGLILLAAAPCTAMVFVWSNLCDGEPHFTLSQVALNDVIMVFAFAPIVALLLGLSAITVPWETLLLSVALYIVVPVILAQVIRQHALSKGGVDRLQGLLGILQPLSLIALLATLVLLFGFQGEQILAQPLIIAMLALPILIQVYFNSGIAYVLNRAAGEAHCVAGPSALIGASNFFELAVAAAISLFGFSSGAALATVVGVLIEVPVMLSVVKIVNGTRGWYEQGSRVVTSIGQK
jgi:ACR3 family arsenite transporter